MDWKTIHSYAEEAELWTTLAVNSWAILTGLVVFGYWVRTDKIPPAEYVAGAALETIGGVAFGILSVASAFAGFFLSDSIGGPHIPGINPVDVKAAVGLLVVLVICGPILFLNEKRRARRSKEKRPSP